VDWICLAQDKDQCLSLEQGNKPSLSTRCEEYFAQISDSYVLKKKSVP
jgi:hypothetical protein